MEIAELLHACGMFFFVYSDGAPKLNLAVPEKVRIFAFAYASNVSLNKKALQ